MSKLCESVLQNLLNHSISSLFVLYSNISWKKATQLVLHSSILDDIIGYKVSLNIRRSLSVKLNVSSSTIYELCHQSLLPVLYTCYKGYSTYGPKEQYDCMPILRGVNCLVSFWSALYLPCLLLRHFLDYGLFTSMLGDAWESETSSMKLIHEWANRRFSVANVTWLQ